MKYYFIIACLFVTSLGVAQISINGNPIPNADGTSAFLNASGFVFSSSNGFTADGSGNVGKGLALPRTDLTLFTFSGTELFGDFPTQLDGMIVYNNGAGLTPSSGSGIGGQLVEPGFYYFSNPGEQFNTDSGRWIPIAGVGNGVKTKEVIKTINPGANTAIVNLNDGDAGAGSGMSAVTVNEFIGAKVYVNNVAKDLQMSATSGYNKASNELTTGNGFMYQVLAPGTYRFVIEYK